jgi:general secretion pathway protein I
LRRSAEHGFTLLEMLVALAVFSLAALALIRLQSVTVRTAADLSERTMAQVVAHNLMVELATDARPPAMGDSEGEVENGGKAWHWARHVAALDDRRLIRVDLVVEGGVGQSPAALSFVRGAE